MKKANTEINKGQLRKLETQIQGILIEINDLKRISYDFAVFFYCNLYFLNLFSSNDSTGKSNNI